MNSPRLWPCSLHIVISMIPLLFANRSALWVSASLEPERYKTSPQEYFYLLFDLFTCLLMYAVCLMQIFSFLSLRILPPQNIDV